MTFHSSLRGGSQVRLMHTPLSKNRFFSTTWRRQSNRCFGLMEPKAVNNRTGEAGFDLAYTCKKQYLMLRYRWTSDYNALSLSTVKAHEYLHRLISILKSFQFLFAFADYREVMERRDVVETKTYVSGPGDPSATFQGAPGQVTVVTVPGSNLSPDPVSMRCPNCGQQIITTVTYDNGSCTWLAMGLLCLFGCVLGCCLIPLCANGAKDAIHTCPNCQHVVGRYKRL